MAAVCKSVYTVHWFLLLYAIFGVNVPHTKGSITVQQRNGVNVFYIYTYATYTYILIALNETVMESSNSLDR